MNAITHTSTHRHIDTSTHRHIDTSIKYNCFQRKCQVFFQKSSSFYIIIFFSAISIFAKIAYAESLKDRRDGAPFVVAGDVLQIALPASAFIYSAVIGDRDGMWSCALSAGTALAATHALKWSVGRPRPFQDADARGNSFPSGHTTAAFVGAAQWQRRYGWAYGIPAYALAAATGYSRVWGGWHYWSDVAAGAAIGIAAPHIFTKRYEQIQVSGSANHINLTWSF